MYPAARRTLFITYSALFTAVVFISTTVFSLYIPETKGFFNLGESGVYLAAFIGGPIIGGIAGGLGSALADYALGYFHYMPATLLIKGLEGFLVGYLSRRIKLKSNLTSYLIFTFAVVISGILLYLFGSLFYVGSAELTIVNEVFEVNVLNLFWLSISVLFIASMIVLTFKEMRDMNLILSALIGGLEMILGYYLYEQFILKYFALAEVPFNVMQVIIGLMISTYVFEAYKRAGFKPFT